MNTLLIKSCILVLLPMVPAYIMFKAFPSTGEGSGTFWGWKWKFGGAFAAYLIVMGFLYVAIKPSLASPEYEVWTVRGSVDARNLPNFVNLFTVRSAPQVLTIEPDGSYEIKVLVRRNGDELQFPRLFLSLTQGCGDVIPVLLDGKPGTFKVLGAAANVGVKRQDGARLIDVETVSLDALNSKNCRGGS